MASNFLCFQLFCTKWWHLAPDNFFSQNSNSFPRYWGPNFGPFKAKSDSWMKLLIWKEIYVSRTSLKYVFFHFLKIWVQLYKKKQILTLLCLLLSRNHGLKPQKSEFSSNFETSYLLWLSLAHTFFWFLWKPFGVLTLCGAKIMCKQGSGTEWSLKIQFLFKNCFAMQPIMVAALSLVQDLNTL